MPRSSRSSARARIALLTCCADVSCSTSTVRSTNEAVGTGTRTAKPCKRPASSGIRRPIALAALVAGVGVHGGHDAVADAECLVEQLDHGRETAGRAGRVGDDVVAVRVVHL